jgi:hypothetical protein
MKSPQSPAGKQSPMFSLTPPPKNNTKMYTAHMLRNYREILPPLNYRQNSVCRAMQEAPRINTSTTSISPETRPTHSPTAYCPQPAPVTAVRPGFS